MRCSAGLIALLLFLCLAHCRAAEPAAPASGKPPVVVLDTSGFWRMHHALSMPLIRFDDGLKAIPPAGSEAKPWTNIVSQATAHAPAGWAEPEFDDGSWYRGTGAAVCCTPYVARLCMRGRFAVTNRAKVEDLALVVDYHGGVVVYLNGKELARQHLAPGTGADALAEDYGEDAFVDANGALLTVRGNEPLLMKEPLTPDTLDRIGRRTRTLKVRIPSDRLQEGVNVVGIEIVRAAYHKVLDAHKVVQKYKSKELTHDMSWNTCELQRVQLTAAGAAGLVPNAARPTGLQVWNSNPLATDFDLDFGDPCEPLRPVRLVGACGGTYSGKVVAGSDKPIRGLKAVAGDLVGPGNERIPAASVRIRYALPWDVCRTTSEGTFETTAYPVEAKPLYALAENPPEECPVFAKSLEPTKLDPSRAYSIRRYSLEAFRLSTPGQPVPVPGAVVPVWVTVKVPRETKAGRYSGQVTVYAEDKQAAVVPIEMNVVDYVLPDPDDYSTWVELVQCPDTLAVEYGVPLWSDRHFELISHSLSYFKDIGSRVLYVPLIAHTNLGNEQSMVRWIRGDDGRYEYDFTVMDRYLDAAEQHMGKPKIVVFQVWDLYLYQAGGKAYAYVGGQTRQTTEKRGELGPLVTIVDPATGKTENVSLPPYKDPSSKGLWQPLLGGLRERMRRRGLEDAMMLGLITDAWPSQEQVQFMKDIGSDLPWVSASHARHDAKKAMYGIADVGYQAHAFAFSCGFTASLHGWDRPSLNACYERWGGFPATMLTRWRAFPEYAIMGNSRGVGRIGAEFWLAVRDKAGRRKGRVHQRFPEASWRQLSLLTSVLAPGPDGAVATARFEALREGVQEAEARIMIERALSSKELADKLGPDLAERCRQALDERRRAMYLSVASLQVGPEAQHAFAAWRGCYFAGVNGYRWFLSSGWQDRSEKLYALASEVAAKLADR